MDRERVIRTVGSLDSLEVGKAVLELTEAGGDQLSTVALELFIRQKIDQHLRLFALGNRLMSNLSPVNSIIEKSFILAKERLLRPQAVFVFIEDVFLVLSIAEVKEWFTFVEHNSDELRMLVEHNANVNVMAVRALAGLMRRLSKATNVVFCGRVLFTLSRIMPLSDPSGVNKKGLTNTSNEITFSTSGPTDAMDVDGEDSSSNKTADSKRSRFHRQFWRFIQYLQDPRKVKSQDQWSQFIPLANTVLHSFSSTPTLENQQEDPNETYFARFLTSPELIELETQDPYFRRHVLVQILIFLVALDKSSTKVMGDYSLPAARKQRVKSWTSKAVNLLKQTPPDGQEFTQLIEDVLAREEFWVEWKREGCHPYSQSARDSPILKEFVEPPLLKLGDQSLKTLWETPFTLEDAEPSPSLLKILNPAIEELEDPDEDPALRLLNSKMFKWRAYRVLGAHKYPLITDLSQTNHENTDPLVSVLKKISANGSPSMEIDQQEEQEEEEQSNIMNYDVEDNSEHEGEDEILDSTGVDIGEELAIDEKDANARKMDVEV